MIEIAKLKFVHKYVHDCLPPSFTDMWVTNRQMNPLNNLYNADLFYVPPCNIDLYKQFPLYTFPLAWNAADDNKYNPNRFTFLSSKKESLFENLI